MMRKDGQNTFFSKWKYNQTKMLNGDNAAFTKDSDADQEVNRNHGCMIDGFCVFCCQQGSDC